MQSIIYSILINQDFAQHSCQTALIKANEYWLNSINYNKISGSLFIDFKQAFDTINHTILAKKLSYYGLSDSCVQFLSSFLTARGQCVSFNKSISSLTNIKRGVPQGSVLGPLLFSIYINDGILLFGGAAAHQLKPLKSLQKRAVKLVIYKKKTVLLTS